MEKIIQLLSCSCGSRVVLGKEGYLYRFTENENEEMTLIWTVNNNNEIDLEKWDGVKCGDQCLIKALNATLQAKRSNNSKNYLLTKLSFLNTRLI